MWLRSSAVLVVGIAYLFVNPSGAPDLFPIVIGCSAFVAVLVGLLVAITLAWRFTHRERRTELDRQAAINFGSMCLFGLVAAACLFIAGACTVGLVQGLGDQLAYDSAPSCTMASKPSCRLQADGRVVRSWAESSRGRHWIEVTVLGHNQTIEVETAYDVWNRLAVGERVEVTSWKGRATEVSVPGVGSMQTVDSPNSALIPLIAFLVGSLFGLLRFSAYGLIYRVKWRAALRGIETPEIAA